MTSKQKTPPPTTRAQQPVPAEEGATPPTLSTLRKILAGQRAKQPHAGKVQVEDLYPPRGADDDSSDELEPAGCDASARARDVEWTLRLMS